MRILNDNFNIDFFFNKLRTSSASLLFLDYDGTLAPFQIDPKQAIPYPGILDRLNTLIEKTSTKLVLISGRAIQDLLPLIPLKHLPEIWGAHGGERYTIEHRYSRAKLSENHLEGLKKGWNDALTVVDAKRCEKKPTSIAVHWRGIESNEVSKIDKDLTALWQPLVTQNNLDIHRFDGGLELRPHGLTKRNAVSTVLSEIEKSVPFAYLGDDATDEEAFAFISSNGLKVLVRKESRETLADIQIIPPEELLDFLDKWIENTNK